MIEAWVEVLVISVKSPRQRAWLSEGQCTQEVRVVDEHLLKVLQISGVFVGVQLLVKLEDWLTILAKKHLPKGSRIRKIVLIKPDED